MAEHELPSNFKKAAIAFLYGTVVFALGFEGVVKTVEGEIVTAVLCFGAAGLLTAGLIWWNNRTGGAARKMLPYAFVAIGVLGALLIVAAVIGFVASRDATAITTTTQTTAASVVTTAPSSPANVLAERASIRLLMRPNQEPQELAKENVWRWFVFRSVGQTQDGKHFPIGTYIFLTFDRPTNVSYRRVFSPSNPDLRFQVIEITESSMVIKIDNVELSGVTVEAQISAKPL